MPLHTTCHTPPAPPSRQRHIMPNALRKWVRRQDGNVTVEFVIVVPFLLSLFFASVDAGITMLRQVFLDRAVDIAVREVRLGNLSESDSLAQEICSRTSLIADCGQNITVEMVPIDTTNFAGLTDPIQCVDRELGITPAVAFNPGAGGSAQELMLLRVCIAADPFIRLTGYLSSMPINADGEYVLVSRGVFVNEPQ